MKKIVFLFILFPFIAFAQTESKGSLIKFSLGVQPEFGRLHATGDQRQTSFQNSWTAGLLLGGNVQLRLFPKAYFQIGLASGERRFNYQETNKEEQQTSAITHQTELTLESFDISAGLTYEFLSYDKLAVSINASAAYQVYEHIGVEAFSYRGSSANQLDYHSFQGSPVGQNYMLTGQFGFVIDYRLGAHSGIFFQPTYSFSLTDTQMDHLQGHRFEQIAVLTGLKFFIGD
ncbi:MAG: outer membrane beta-barrel protein [Saprospiraceae bacterium]|nr:outer membrane beta-barrel protein [Saprospiraceae bacterium]